MMNRIDTLQRQHLQRFTPYASARRSMSGGRIWLNANESPYANEFTSDDTDLNRYPEFQSAELNAKYAAYAGVSVDNVLSSRGSDEGIELLIKAFCEPRQDSILICPPTYGMYAISAQAAAVTVQEAPLNEKWQLDVPQVVELGASCKVIFLCSPSNPVGNPLNPDDIQQVLEQCPNSLVVVDEAYIEFSSEPTTVPRLKEFPNLVVLRTLSKAFALAGIRCGFLLANAPVIGVLHKVLAPYPLPSPSVRIAVQALETDAIRNVHSQVSQIVEERCRVKAQLTSLPLRLIADSETNFLLYQCDDAASLVKSLAQNGVLIRDQSAQRGLSNVVRITLGSPNENNELIQQLQDYYL